MFFIGVFGTGFKEKVVGEVVLDQCPHCEGLPQGEVVTRYSYFHLFFLPIYKWNQDFAVYCRQCRTWYHLEPELGHEIEKGTLKTLNFWQLKNGDMGQAPHFCKGCGSETDPEYLYCPRCGMKQNT